VQSREAFLALRDPAMCGRIDACQKKSVAGLIVVMGLAGEER